MRTDTGRARGCVRLRGAAAGDGQDRGATPVAGRARAVRRVSLIVTCEHGGNQIPARFAECFADHRGLLLSHRGFDHGALDFARTVAHRSRAPLIASRISRLLVDLNRSADHPALHGAELALSPAWREDALRTIWTPYRAAVERIVAQRIAAGLQVLHLSCHSFTPLLHGRMRATDIGLLHDASRAREAALCRDWRRRLAHALPRLRVRLNHPYDGASDGLTTTLRQRYGAQRYLGIEIEINQKRIVPNPRHWRALRDALVRQLLNC